MNAAPVEVRLLAPEEDSGPIRALFERAFGSPLAAADWEWKYRAGPHGPPIVALAEEEGRLVGHYALVPRLWRRGGTEIPLLQEVDLMIDPAARGRGIFARLAEAVYERARAGGCVSTFGFPNRVSTPIGTARLGWEIVCPIPVLCRYLRPLARLAALLSGRPERRPPVPAGPAAGPNGLQLAAGLPAPEELDELWPRVGPLLGGAGRRDAAYAAWRYAAGPDCGRRIAAARAGGRLEGVLVWRPAGPGVAWIEDLWADPDGPAPAARALLDHALAEAHAAGAGVVRAWNLAGPFHRLYRQAGFLPRRAGIHHVVRPLVSGPARIALLRPGSWYLARGDGDGP